MPTRRRILQAGAALTLPSVARADGGERMEGVNEVAKRAQLDDQNPPGRARPFLRLGRICRHQNNRLPLPEVISE